MLPLALSRLVRALPAAAAAAQCSGKEKRCGISVTRRQTDYSRRQGCVWDRGVILCCDIWELECVINRAQSVLVSQLNRILLAGERDVGNR